MNEEVRATKPNPTVSVIMPCFNDGEYLLEAVDSIKKQTYSPIELVIIDDGSDDEKTVNALNSINYHNLKIIRTDHIRPAGARNRGIKESTGKYILPLDADDIIDASYIERAVEELETDDNLGIVYCHADLFGLQTGKWELPDYDFKYEILDNCIFVSAVFRKEDWVAVGGFCEDFHYGMEDYDFWLSILELGRTVKQFDEVWFHYRIKKSSRTTEFINDYERVQETYSAIFSRHRDFYLTIFDTYCTELRRNLIDQIFQNRSKATRIDELNKIVKLQTSEWCEFCEQHQKVVKRSFSLIEICVRIKHFFKRLFKKDK
ncbi:MAG: glycosyltransferase family 2 protein [Oscillospiraceae bacterium]|nr:glycosyltransferase family 2 protein [Oscillospiraceae bacterium]